MINNHNIILLDKWTFAFYIIMRFISLEKKWNFKEIIYFIHNDWKGEPASDTLTIIVKTNLLAFNILKILREAYIDQIIVKKRYLKLLIKTCWKYKIMKKWTRWFVT